MMDRETEMGYRLNPACRLAFSSLQHDRGHSYFSGYYYPSPLRGEKLLCHRTAFDGRDTTWQDRCEIGYWDLVEHRFVVCGETHAFNWQQGAMLQWLPDGKRFIFNARQDDHFVSVIDDLETQASRVLPYPVCALHPSGKFALAVNFEHLAFCREGYHYKGVEHKQWDVGVHPEDGISRVDLETGKVRLLVSTASMAAIKPRRDMKGCYHWLEHMMWNPSGTRFAFLHRWAPGDPSGARHVTRLFTANADGTNVFMFPDVGFYSHFNWHDENTLTVWSARPEKSLGSLFLPGAPLRRWLKPAYARVKKFLPQKFQEGSDSFQELVEYTDRTPVWSLVGQGLLTRNGHYTWTKNGRYLLSDTYEDGHQRRHLFLYDSLRRELLRIGDFASPFNRNSFRCDLHPRFDESQGRVIIDSAHEGQRHVFVIDIGALVNRRSSV